MRIGLSADSVQHLPEYVESYLAERGVEIQKYGALAGEKADYVDAARSLAEAVASRTCDEGILFCNTGTGVSIIANKIPGARATLCVDEFSAKIAKLANNANIIILSMRLTGDMLARQILDVWFQTDPADAEERRKVFHKKTDELDALYRKG
jgi:ribose 5-phosphate isomerase B